MFDLSCRGARRLGVDALRFPLLAGQEYGYASGYPPFRGPHSSVPAVRFSTSTRIARPPPFLELLVALLILDFETQTLGDIAMM